MLMMKNVKFLFGMGCVTLVLCWDHIILIKMQTEVVILTFEIIYFLHSCKNAKRMSLKMAGFNVCRMELRLIASGSNRNVGWGCWQPCGSIKARNRVASTITKPYSIKLLFFVGSREILSIRYTITEHQWFASKNFVGVWSVGWNNFY